MPAFASTYFGLYIAKENEILRFITQNNLGLYLSDTSFPFGSSFNLAIVYSVSYIYICKPHFRPIHPFTKWPGGEGGGIHSTPVCFLPAWWPQFEPPSTLRYIGSKWVLIWLRLLQLCTLPSGLFFFFTARMKPQEKSTQFVSVLISLMATDSWSLFKLSLSPEWVVQFCGRPKAPHLICCYLHCFPRLFQDTVICFTATLETVSEKDISAIF